MLFRFASLTALVLAMLSAWPQGSDMRMAHPDHVIVEVPDNAPYPAAAIALEADPVDGFNLFLDTANFKFTPQWVNREPVPNEGHAHLYLNGKKAARLYSEWRHLAGNLFEQGVNRVEVVLNANDHSTWGLAGEPIGDEVLVYAQVSEGSPIIYGDVAYRVSWEWGEAKPISEEGGWMVTNDLGYEIHIQAGKLVTRNLELVPCHAPPSMKPLARLFEKFGSLTAYAGHGSMLPNASRISKSFMEDLAKPTDRNVEIRRVRDPDYCQGHFLIARPSGTPPATTNLAVSGTWARDGSEPKPFEIRGATAYGRLKDLVAASSGLAERQSIIGGVQVEIRRELDSMFNGVDFASMSETAQANRITRSIVDNARLLAQ